MERTKNRCGGDLLKYEVCYIEKIDRRMVWGIASVKDFSSFWWYRVAFSAASAFFSLPEPKTRAAIGFLAFFLGSWVYK